MNPISILLLGFAMSTDAFAAAIGKGAGMLRPRLGEALRAGVIFGAIEAITPVLGWLLGRGASRFIQAWDHWLAFGLLLGLGLHMIWAGLQPDQGDTVEVAKRPGFVGLALTGLSTSIDALAVGVGLAFVDVSIGAVAVVIGLCTCCMVTVGILLGRVLGAVVGKGAEIAGGVVLIGVGAVILYEHLSAAA
ncbi:MAG: manganese efflux pump MntP family protein [Xanthomonadales bacterium]|nr:manganese efflux pump MntP family protein [Xanthomonadales bacterium]